MTDTPATPAVPRRSGLVKRLALAGGVLVAMLLLAEALVRLAVPEPVSIRFGQDVKELKKFDLDTFAGVLVNDPELFWKLSPGSKLPSAGEDRGPFFGVIANGQGFREDHEIPAAKPGNTVRVLFLGDSCTFGFGVDHAETFVEHCEDRLRERRGPRATAAAGRVECINAGVPGYTLWQGCRLFETRGETLEPDIVVACFGFNDRAAWDGLGDLEHSRLGPPGLLKQSHLARMAFATQPASGPTAADRPRVTADEFRGLLTRLHSGVRKLGSRLVLVAWCERFQVEDDREERTPHQFELYQFARRHDLPLVDLVPLVQGWADEADPPPLFLDFVHATPTAHARIAGAIAETLAGLLPGADELP